ncbi:MAG TPA: ABC transporter substrate-binding protein [Caulobacteraceae bacterium]
MRLAGLFAAGVMSLSPVAGAGAPRVVSLDQCADQYVLALSPHNAIAGLSKRARNVDSYLRATAAGLPRRRATSEAILAADPAVVVRYWGGDARLTADLERRGVHVVTLEDSTDFGGVRRNVRMVAAALAEGEVGEALIGRMDRTLAADAGVWRGAPALYLTSGGYTAGSDTLIGAMLSAAGLRNLGWRSGFHEVPLEELVLQPPSAIVRGFFDAFSMAYQQWSLGRQPVVGGLARGRTVVSLPAAILGCPAWFAADGVSRIAMARQHG